MVFTNFKWKILKKSRCIPLMLIFLLLQFLLMIDLSYLNATSQWMKNSRRNLLMTTLARNATIMNNTRNTSIYTASEQPVLPTITTPLTTENLILKCNITANDTLSAIRRAKTTYCKREIARTKCLLSQNKSYPMHLPNLCPYSKGKMVEKQIKLFDNKTETLETDPVKIVFVLIVNGRQLRQIHRLFKAIYHPDHYYYIHVDSRQDYLYRELLPLTEYFTNVRMSSRRFATIWGGTKVIEAHKHFFRELLQMTDWNWDYWINLSESQYPIKKLESLVAVLTKYKGYNFKDISPKIADSLHYDFLQCEDHMWRLGPRTLPSGIEFYHGGDWFALHRTFCYYVGFGSDELLNGLRQLYTHALIPDEKFLHTLLMNSYFCDTVAPQDITMVNWNRKRGCTREKLNVVDWGGCCSPLTITMEHLPRIKNVATKPMFFARKFDPTINQEIINYLDAKLYGSNVTGYDYFWENNYHHLDPHVNNVRLSFYISFIMRTRRYLSSRHCHVKPDKILESNLVFKLDKFYGITIMYEASLTGKRITLETLYTVKPLFTKSNTSVTSKRLQDLEVSTDFDQKELIFRNHARFVGPNSSITIKHSWDAGVSKHVTVTIINPNGLTASSGVITLRNTSYTMGYKPYLKPPHMTGIWLVNLTYKNVTIGSTKFLVLPLLPIPSKEQDGQFWQKQLHESIIFRTFTENTPINAKSSRNRTVKHQTSDSSYNITSEFWTIEKTCVIDDSSHGCKNFPACRDVLWSSRSLDPKSDISHLLSKFQNNK